MYKPPSPPKKKDYIQKLVYSSPSTSNKKNNKNDLQNVK